MHTAEYTSLSARRRTCRPLPFCLSICLIFLYCCGCTTAQESLPAVAGHPAPAELPAGMQLPPLPADCLQPWEQTDRTGSVISPDSEMLPGREWFLAAQQGVVEKGEAANLQAVPGSSSHVIYRMPLDAQPGVLGVDANPMEGSSYFVAVADHSSHRWRWSGPFRDSHVRLSLAGMVSSGADFRSSLGNMFVALLVSDGDSVDVVALGANTVDGSDADAPAVPTGLVATAVAGGFELDWDDNAEADLAGYQLHYSTRAFISPDSAGVRSWPHLLGSPGLLLPASQDIYMKLLAVDISGNRSAPTDLLEGSPLAGQPPVLQLDADSPSGIVGAAIALTVGGAQSYDWDLDGDGVFEITGDVSGTQQAYTDRLGLIRPAVRGYGADETVLAHGSVSLLISGNSRPVAVAAADPAFGVAPLVVDFSGTESTDFDGEVVGGGWDFDGDGTYDVWDDTDIVHVTAAQHSYDTPGTYNAKLRVVDDEGSWDVDTLTISVAEPDPGPDNLPPTASLTADPPGGEKGVTVHLDASGSSDSDGEIDNYEWDLNGNGIYGESGAESDNKGNATLQQTFAEPGIYEFRVRVTDDDGDQHSAGVEVAVRGWAEVRLTLGAPEQFRDGSLAVVAGHPVVCYRANSIPPDLRYAWSSTTHGSQAENWTSVVIAEGSYGAEGDIQSVNGHPAIVGYEPISNILTYARSTTVSGSDPADWIFVTVHDETDTGGNPRLGVFEGKPAIAYEFKDVSEIHFAWSDTAEGSSSTDWSHVRVSQPGNSCSDPSLALVNGSPAISYYDATIPGLVYAKSFDANGHDLGDWQRVTIDTGLAHGHRPSLGVVNGYPAVSYYDGNSDDLRYMVAKHINGNNVIHWDLPVDVASVGALGAFASLVTYGNSPRVVYYIDGAVDINLAICDTAYGRDATDWSTQLVENNADNGPSRIDAEIVNGRLAFVFDETSNEIAYRVLID